MLCALSQFLDNNVHVAESASTQDSQSCGLDSNRNSLTVEKAKNTFVSKCKVGEKNHGASCFKLSKLDFRTTQAYMVQSKSFPTNEQSNYLSVEANCDDEKNNFMVYEREHASGIHCFNWSEASNVSGAQRSKLADKFLSHIFQGGQGNVQRHNRRHLPVPKGPHTVGCVDLMCDLADHGTFFRLYYPTNPTNIQVRVISNMRTDYTATSYCEKFYFNGLHICGCCYIGHSMFIWIIKLPINLNH